MPPGSFPIGTGVPLDFGPGHNPGFTGDSGPRLYSLSLTSGLSFVGGADLYPDPALYPSPDLYPFGGALLFQLNRAVPVATLQPVGTLSTGAALTRTFTAVFQPLATFTHTPARLLSASARFAGSLSAQKAGTAFAKSLFASLTAAGSLSTVLNPGQVSEGGGGFGVPMPDAFFQRYQPTLRRQKTRV